MIFVGLPGETRQAFFIVSRNLQLTQKSFTDFYAVL